MKISTLKIRTYNSTIPLVLVAIAICLLPVFSSAQVGQWTWLHGPKVTNVLGSFGSQQTPAPTNNPPGLYEPCQWTDTSLNFWMFGGIDFNGNKYGDLWEYVISTNEWTWINGTGNTNDPGYYGVQGVPSLGNVPPARSHGMSTWTDKNNNLWFFGGSNDKSNSFNDLWEYVIDPTGNTPGTWTWMKGPDTTGNQGNYGTMGVPDPANLPPCRYECPATWVDSSGDLWLFGGYSSNPTDNTFNDLWRYHIATNTWTWMKGSNVPDNPGSYGTEKIENASNLPPARATYAHLKDAHQNLWIFGGFNSEYAVMNDIWRYNPVTNNWVWLSGSKTSSGATPVYGTKCVADSLNIPGGRFENRACWTDKSGNLWFFGGFTDLSNNNESNELWKFCIESDEWTLVSGDTIPNPTGNWGTILVPAPNNKPDGRGGSDSWIDTAKGNLYLYGGAVDTLNYLSSHADMWRFSIDTNCGTCPAVVLPVAHFQASDTIVCQNDCLSFSDLSTNATSWIWKFPGAFPDTSTSENPANICYYSPGTYNVSLIATSYKGSSQITLSNFIKVNPTPAPPVITTLHGDTLHCSTSPSYVSYQWFLDSAAIKGATDTILVISHGQGGNYNVQVKDSNGCTIAVGINILGIQEYTLDGTQFTISPNPVADILKITASGKPQTTSLKLGIYNVLGQNVHAQQLEAGNSKLETTLDVSSLSSGIYFIQLANDTGRWIGRFVKE